MQSLNERIGSKIRLKWTVPWFSVFVDQTNLKTIWKFSLSQYRCHKTPIDVENCVKSCIKLESQKTKFYGDYQLRWWRLPIEERACRKIHLGGGDYLLRNSGLPPPMIYPFYFIFMVNIYSYHLKVVEIKENLKPETDVKKIYRV